VSDPGSISPGRSRDGGRGNGGFNPAAVLRSQFEIGPFADLSLEEPLFQQFDLL